jgi:formate hydrogenlyase transcriptional activator
VTVNCAALPSTLVESELFGSEEGAYTGALSKRLGRFEVADGSTIFLDEVGDLPADTQVKLLRVLQEGQFERVGSSQTTTVNVRIVAATNRDLAAAVQAGSFREDLYYRLNVFPISVPPLRERSEDIAPLVWAFVEELGTKMGKSVESISRRTMQELQAYPWPGNVRELRNVIERAMIPTKGSKLRVEVPTISDSKARPNMTLEELERQYILDVLDKTTWRVSGKNGAAEILGLKPTTLEARMAKLGIKRER